MPGHAATRDSQINQSRVHRLDLLSQGEAPAMHPNTAISFDTREGRDPLTSRTCRRSSSSKISDKV